MYLNVKIMNGFIDTDERPTTSRQISPKKKFKKQSPRKNAGGKVYRFKKIKDDQARKLVRRSVLIMSDNQTPKKFGQGGKGAKRLINSNNKKFSHHNLSPNRISPNKLKNKKKLIRKSKDTLSVNTLEEGEIRSEDERSIKSKQRAKSDDDSEDDCIVIEPTVEKIEIDDEEDEDKDKETPSTSILSTSYQSLIKSFNERISSTPCNKYSKNIDRQQPQSPVTATIVKKSESPNNDKSKETPLFFEDVNGRPWFETINSTDHFADYTKLSTMRENPILKRRSVRLKSKSSAEIIDLDDTNLDGGDSTLEPNKLKRKSCELDDSVIFISETNDKDFISITDVNNPRFKIRKLRDDTSTPPNRIRSNNMYTKSETKQLAAYNENAYNPKSGEELTSGKRMVIIDGSNVAFKHSLDKFFSVKGLKIAIDYFEKLGHEVKAVIPQFRMNKNKSTDHEELERLHKAGKIVQTPCKNLPGLTSISYDDRFVLQLAFELDAAIVSNDNYRDLLHENPAFKKMIENRVIGYTWCNDIFILPKDPYGKWGPTLHTILNR